MPHGLILASRSPIRADLLTRAGLDFETMPAAIDEAEVKRSLRAEGAPPRDVADMLAEMKAARISRRFPDRLILGADQVLALGDRIFDKPADLAEAREHLLSLRGVRHVLLSAAVICEAGRPVWRHVGKATLTMRAFSDVFLEHYLERNGSAILDSVGGYKIEQGGAALFDAIEGDYFSILGLPLLPLLAYLRLRGAAQT